MANSVLNIIVNGTDNASGMLRGVGGALDGFGKKALGAGAAVTGLTAPLAIMGGVSLRAAGDFETSMNILEVAAASSQTSLEDLSAAALAVGADAELVGITASEAGEAMTAMYKAGMTTNQVFGDMEGYLEGTASLSGALRAAIDLAAASELDLAQATDVVNVAMNTFGLEAADAGSIADVLVKTADAGVASVSGLADSFRTVGPVAAAMGIGMDDLSTALSLMASRGIEGSEAGTQLKSMLLNMQRDTSDVVGLWDALDVSMYDATGTMKSLPVIMGELEGAMAGMTQEQRNAAIQTLAGTYGLNAMNILLGEGVTGWDGMTDAIDEAAGVQANAEARTKGFNAAMEQLGGVIESIQITVLTPFLQETLTPLIKKFGEAASSVLELDPKLLSLGVAFGALLVAVGPVLMALGTASVVLGALLSPIGLVVAAVAGLGVAWATNFGGIRDAVQPIIEKVGNLIKQFPAWLERFKAAGGPVITFLQTFRQTLLKVWTAITNQVRPTLDTLVGIWNNKLKPAFETAAQALQEHVLPALTRLYEWLGERLPPIIETVGRFFREHILPVLGDVAAFIVGQVVPAIFELVGWLINNIPVAVDTAAKFFRENLLPPLRAVAKWLSENIPKAIEAMKQAWEDAQPAIEIIKDIFVAVGTALGDVWEWMSTQIPAAVDAVKGAFESAAGGIRSVIDTINQAIEKIRTAIENLKEFLRLGSGAGGATSYGGTPTVPVGGGGYGSTPTVPVGGGGYGRMALAPAWNVVINVNGGATNAETGRAVEMGVLRAARQMGLR